MLVPRVDRTDDGHPSWVHTCIGGYVPEVTLPLGSSGWAWTDDGGLSPSIHCMTCGVHGFWVGGNTPVWRSC